jgi:hypothetical protein
LISRTPPKYSCSICGKTFRRKKQHFNHVFRCKARSTNKRVIELAKPEATTMEPPRYYGREYTGNNIPTGMRHLRHGGPQMQRISPEGMRCAI